VFAEERQAAAPSYAATSFGAAAGMGNSWAADIKGQTAAEDDGKVSSSCPALSGIIASNPIFHATF